jgi:hypothetical protein
MAINRERDKGTSWTVAPVEEEEEEEGGGGGGGGGGEEEEEGIHLKQFLEIAKVIKRMWCTS